MRYFNGRVLMRELTHCGSVQGLICARTKVEAVRILKQAGLDFNLRELNEYWSPVWGTAAKEILGEQTEPGFFLEIGCPPYSTFFKLVGNYAKKQTL